MTFAALCLWLIVIFAFTVALTTLGLTVRLFLTISLFLVLAALALTTCLTIIGCFC